MNCDAALMLLLHVDLADPATAHGDPLAAHLAGCARCRRVAAQLRTDTLRLAGAVAVAPRTVRGRATRAWRPLLVGGMVVAAIAIVFAFDPFRQPARVPIGESTEVVAPVITSASSIESPEPQPALRRIPERGSEPSGVERPPLMANVVVASGVQPQPFEAPVPVAAQPFAPPEPVRAMSLYATAVVAVVATLPPDARLPSPSTRGGVAMPSPDPDITVLWFD